MRKNGLRFLLALAVGTAACGGVGRTTCVASPKGIRDPGPLEPSSALKKAVGALKFNHNKASENLSDGAAIAPEELAFVTDEGTEFGIVEPATGKTRTLDLLALMGDLSTTLGSAHPDEVDLEAVAAWDTKLVLAGSASLKRQKTKAGKDNATRMAQVIPASGEGNAHANYVWIVDAGDTGRGEPRLIDHWDLRALLLADPLLAPFRELPSKDNGIDVEGVAADAQHLYFGLRGPVLRGHALVVRTDWKGQAPQLSFLNLQGLGIRALVREPDGKGLYVLAGPTMDLDGPVAIYAWNGRDSVFESDDSRALAHVMDVPSDGSHHPEALFVWQGALCILSDGPKAGDPACAPRRDWPL